MRVNDVWIEKDTPTFDRFFLYTEKQSTGVQDLTFRDGQVDPWGSVPYTPTSKEVLRTSEKYRVNIIRDIATAQPVISKSWTDRQDEYNGRQGYIDLVSKEDNINYDATEWDLIEIRDLFHKTRLFFDNDNGSKIVIDHVNTMSTAKQL